MTRSVCLSANKVRSRMRANKNQTDSMQQGEIGDKLEYKLRLADPMGGACSRATRPGLNESKSAGPEI